jgi:capsular exopolysaccharide synthesis family protein
MSRFYDALKEANRSRQNPEGDPGDAEWAELGMNAIEVPPVPSSHEMNNAAPPAPPVAHTSPAVAHAAQAAAPAVAHAPGPFDGLWSSAAEEVLNSFAPQKNGTVGTAAKVALDQKARLLPHAVDSVVLEHYRRLRAKILQEQEKKPFRTLMVTSPGPQDGKTVTVLNLGLNFAMLPSFKVLVVDGDLRRGNLGDWLGVDEHPGLSNLIDGSASLDDVILKSPETPMHFMVRGNSRSSPGELLHSPRLPDYFREIAEEYSLVLVDSPPVNLIADAQLLAHGCDAVLLIARAFATTRKGLERAVQDLAPFRMIGTVLNAGSQGKPYRRYGYGYY